METHSPKKKAPPPGAIEILPASQPAAAGSPTSTAAAGGGRVSFVWIPWLVGIVVLVAIVWGFVSIRPVAVSTDPVASSLRLDGGMAWRSGDTWYLTAGDWSVTAAVEGYYELNESIEVSRTGVNEFYFAFKPLPGRLLVTAVDAVSQQPVDDFSYTVDGVDGTPDLLIPPGTVDVVVTHPAYLDGTASVEIVGRGEESALRLELVPRKGVLSLPRVLPEVAVWLDGKREGKGPGEWQLEPGEHVVELRRSGYRTWERKVDVVSGERLEIVDTELAAMPAKVRFRSQPAGAQVMLDNAVAGVAPFERQLAPGVYAARAVLAGHKSAEELLDLSPGDERTVDFELEAITGKLFVVAPEATIIAIDGEVWTGDWPAILPLGPHRVEAKYGDLPPAVRTVIIRPDRDATLTFEPPVAVPKPPEEPEPSVPVASAVETVLVRVPDATFRIGSPRGEPDRRANEAQRTVRLTRDFHLGVTEVTVAQYAAFDAAYAPDPESGAAGHPVVGISWDQAARFCNYLSEQDGLPVAYVDEGGRMRSVWPLTDGWRLPTEAEWELAMRVGSPVEGRFPWGPQLPPPQLVGNLGDESSGSASRLEGYDDKFAETAPVRSFLANALGLYDLVGNAAEWCHDYYNLSSGDPARIDVDPAGPERGVHHVVKGSSYRHYRATHLRAAFRDYSSATRDDVGFRVARFVRKPSP